MSWKKDNRSNRQRPRDNRPADDRPRNAPGKGGDAPCPECGHDAPPEGHGKMGCIANVGQSHYVACGCWYI